jgi:phytoene dehydrogenase-like protein
MVSARSSTEHYGYAVVGMGIGGLTIAALLAAAGERVIIFEQHYLPGGYGHTFLQRGFAFCAELHYVWDCGPGERVTRMLEKVGLGADVTFNRLDPEGFDRIVGPDVDYTIGSGFVIELERLAVQFPEHRNGLRRYYEVIDSIHRQMYDLPIGFSWQTVLSRPMRYSSLLRYYRSTLEDLFQKLGFPEALRLILAGQSAIFFTPPRDLSLLAHAGGVGSYNQGAYHPAQSYQHVMDSLLGGVERSPGCRTLLSTEVTDVSVEGGVARSLTTAAGDTFTAGTFLLGMDAQLSLDMIGREHFLRSFRKKLEYDYGPSVVSVYLGLRDIDLREHGLGEENVFWHPKTNLNEVYDDQLGDSIPERPYFFFNAPTLREHDARLAPDGGDQLVMVAPCSYDLFADLRARSEADYQTAKQTFADRIIAVMESEFVPALSDHIVVKTVGTPLTNEYYVWAPRGNCYVTPLDPGHVNMRRLNHRSPFENVHYVGSSASLPGFATVVHFACLLYEQLTGDSVY